MAYPETTSDWMDIYQSEEDDIYRGRGEYEEDGCCFPGECCMPGDHLRSECHTAQMIEDFQRYEHPYKKAHSMPSETMPFGKYKGEPFSEIPVGYLDWLIGQDFMQEKTDLKERIETHLSTRPEWQRMDDD